ncbi:MAG TPA: hypothetical protein VFV80_09560 [Geminicoccaceae bacterium]|nr:hypothetical protein [Geminicoccaceae bacterium]
MMRGSLWAFAGLSLLLAGLLPRPPAELAEDQNADLGEVEREVYTDFEMPSPSYTVPGSGVIWTVTRKG